MPAATPSDLASALKSGRFASVYCLWGDEDYRKEDVVRQVIEAAVDSSARDFNVDVRRGSELDACSLGVLVSTLPMMSEHRVVVIRDPAGLKKATRAELERYVADPSPSTILVLVVPADCDLEPWMEEGAQTVELDALAGEKLHKWILNRAKAVGADIEDSAVDLLQEAVGSDLTVLASELDKLASYSHGDRINDDAVGAIVGVVRGETLSDLLDAVAARDVARSLELLPRVLMQPKTSGVSVVMALSVQILGIAWTLARRDDGSSARAVAGEAFGLIRPHGWMLRDRSFSDTARTWASAAQDWSPTDLDAALRALLDADVALKETRVASDEQIVATAILRMCARAGDARAVA